MFSISTVASSTRTPTARARPPSVMILMVGPLGDRNVHGAAAIHLRIAADDVRGDLNHADIAQIYRGPGSGSNRRIHQLLHVAADRGVGRCDLHQAAGSNVSGRKDSGGVV